MTSRYTDCPRAPNTGSQLLSPVQHLLLSHRSLQIGEAIAQLLEHEALVVQYPDVETLTLTHLRKANLGFSDCLILEIARRAGHLPPGTFDRNPGRLDGANGLDG